MLDNIYYNFIKPKHLICRKCAEMYTPTDAEVFDAKQKYHIREEDDLPEEVLEEIKLNHGGIEISLDQMISSFFRDCYENNRLTPDEIIFGKVRKNAEH